MNRHAARIIHAGMVGGVAATVIVFAVVRQAAQVEPLHDLLWLFRLIAFAAVLGVMLAGRVLRSRMAPLGRTDDDTAWWQAHGDRCLVMWALADGSAILGATFWLLTGDMLILVGVTAVSLAVLVAHRPGSLAAR